MPNWFYEGDPETRKKLAVQGIEQRCRERNPVGYRDDIVQFAKQQIPLLTNKNKMCPTWLSNPPPSHLKYVLDAMWFEWERAKVRWGDIIHALEAHFKETETL